MDKLHEHLLKIKDLLEKAESPDLYNMHVKGQKVITGEKSNHVFGPAPLKEINEKFGPTQHIEKTHLLVQHKPDLKKGMNNAGIGGPGAVKTGAVLPSINKMPKLGNASLAGKVKIPGQASATKKNPINVAEQTHNKDIKDIRMKEAHANLVMQKSDEVSFADNGQWSLNEEDLNKGKIMQGIKTAALGGALAIGTMVPQAKASSFDNQVNSIAPTTSVENEASTVKAPKVLNNLEIEARDKYQAHPNENTAKMPLNQIRMANKQVMSNYLNNVNDPGDSTRYEDNHDQFRKDFPHVGLYPEPVAKSDKVSFADNGQWSLSKGAPEYKEKRMVTREEAKQLKNSRLKIVEEEEEQEEETEAPYPKTDEDRKKSDERRTKEIEQSRTESGIKKSLKDRLNDVLEVLNKSNYPGEYDQADNAKRKAKNTSETTGIHSMNSVKAYGGSGPSAAAVEAKKMRIKSSKMPVKIFSPEEIAEMNTSIKKTEGRTTAIPGVSEMGIEVRRSNPESKSYSRVVSPKKHGETAKEIAKENIKQTKEVKPKLP